MEIIFISGCGQPKLMLPLVPKGSGEQMSVFYMLSLVGVRLYQTTHQTLC